MSNESPPSSVTATATFDQVVVPHLEAAHRLARWLTGNEQDAQDVVQEASLRALKYFRSFVGGNGRAWFLRIVRNTGTHWRIRSRQPNDEFDEEHHSGTGDAWNPESQLLHTDDAALIDRSMRHLPARHRELLVRRELDGLSYQELADAMDIPLGTVMSGLSRARRAFRVALTDQLNRTGRDQRARPQDRPWTATRTSD